MVIAHIHTVYFFGSCCKRTRAIRLTLYIFPQVVYVISALLSTALSLTCSNTKDATRIHELFRRFDVNKDGKVSSEEFLHILGQGGLQYSGKVRRREVYHGICARCITVYAQALVVYAYVCI